MRYHISGSSHPTPRSFPHHSCLLACPAAHPPAGPHPPRHRGPWRQTANVMGGCRPQAGNQTRKHLVSYQKKYGNETIFLNKLLGEPFSSETCRSLVNKMGNYS